MSTGLIIRPVGNGAHFHLSEEWCVVSLISEQPEGEWKDFLLAVRKRLDYQEHTWSGDEIDRVMRRRAETLEHMYRNAMLPEDVAEGLLQDLDAWS